MQASPAIQRVYVTFELEYTLLHISQGLNFYPTEPLPRHCTYGHITTIVTPPPDHLPTVPISGVRGLPMSFNIAAIVFPLAVPVRPGTNLTIGFLR